MAIMLASWAQDLTGRRFGRLVVKEPVRRDHGCIVWLCTCDCGASADVKAIKLTTGRTSSCGCFRRENSARMLFRHGGAGTPEHLAWQQMRRRCCKPGSKSYGDYGGRGITVCDKWMNSFEAFFADVGKRPSPGHTLDRIDVNGNYEPGNVRWATKIEQANNTRANRVLTVGGETMTMSQWARRVGRSAGLIHWRLNKGWTPESAVLKPVRRKRFY